MWQKRCINIGYEKSVYKSSSIPTKASQAHKYMQPRQSKDLGLKLVEQEKCCCIKNGDGFGTLNVI